MVFNYRWADVTKKGSYLKRNQGMLEPWAFLDACKLFEKVDLKPGNKRTSWDLLQLRLALASPLTFQEEGQAGVGRNEIVIMEMRTAAFSGCRLLYL